MSTFDYTNRDYLSIKQDLLDRAEINIPEWTSRSSADFGVALVELWAYMGDILHFYIDKAASESFLQTATSLSSVSSFANLLDYIPTPRNSATATVVVVPSSTISGTVTIPVGTSFVAPAITDRTLVSFVSTAEAYVNSGTATVSIPVIEGIQITNEYPVSTLNLLSTSSGSPSQSFTLRYTGVVPSSVTVNVKEGTIVGGVATQVAYQNIQSFSDYSSSLAIFKVETASDNVSTIVFGNGINGKIPTNGAEITVSYRRSIGSSGNLPVNSITSFGSSAPAGVLISSSSAAIGGYDDESIESLKKNVPLLFKTQDRAVSLQDFKDLSLRVPSVIKSTATYSSGTVTVIAVQNQVDYLSTSFGNTITTPATLITNVTDYFTPRILIGTTIAVASTVTLTPVYISLSLTVKTQYVQRWVLDNVINALDSIFDFENVSFGQVLSLGEVYKSVLAVEGVDFINITVFNTSPSGIASGNTITAAADRLLRKKSSEWTITTTGGVVG